MVPTGEQLHQAGADGVRRARNWLASTCRAQVFWDNPERCADKLQYTKASSGGERRTLGDCFSFDLGGILVGGDSNGREFLAEVKSGSSTGGDLGAEYRRFVAKCYRTEVVCGEQPKDHYMWITWTPFLSSRWPDLLTEQFVMEALDHDDLCRAIAGANPDEALAKQVAEKLIIVVLSERQELLLTLHGHEATRVRQRLMDNPSLIGRS